MRKSALLLSALLGVSVLVNVLALLQLQRYREEVAALGKRLAEADGAARRAEDRPPATPARPSAAFDELAGQMASLRSEVAELRRDLREAGAARPADGRERQPAGAPAAESPRSSAAEPLPAGALDPDVARVLSRQEPDQQFWATLQKLGTMREREELDQAAYRDLALRETAAYLQLAGASATGFRDAALLAFDEIDRAEHAQREDGNRLDWQDPAQLEVIRQRHQQHMQLIEAARSRLLPYLSSDPRSETIRRRLDEWFDMVRWGYGEDW